MSLQASVLQARARISTVHYTLASHTKDYGCGYHLACTHLAHVHFLRWSSKGSARATRFHDNNVVVVHIRLPPHHTHHIIVSQTMKRGYHHCSHYHCSHICDQKSSTSRDIVPHTPNLTHHSHISHIPHHISSLVISQFLCPNHWQSVTNTSSIHGIVGVVP